MQKHRIYVDETGFNLNTKRAYGRARQGERVNRIVRRQRGSNVTVITAISDKVGVLYYEVHWETVKRESFIHFMTSLEAVLGDEDAVIILDNAPCHSRINESFEYLQIRFLSPHSPFLNPIEECFSVFKSYLKQHLNDVSLANLNDPAAAARAGVSMYERRRNEPLFKRLYSQASRRPLCRLTTGMLTLTLEPA